tara:strand:+ start:789 stop:1763 length:975 start_codon:yes stop_codon:yes gene_type:complete
MKTKTILAWFAINQIKRKGKKMPKKVLKRLKHFLKSLELEKKSYTAICREIGISYYCGVDSSTKLQKGALLEYKTLGLYLAPATLSGINLCPFACVGCILACLGGSGHNLIEKRSGKNLIDISRIKKAWIAMLLPEVAEKLICHEIERERLKRDMAIVSQRIRWNLAVRLNCTSDLDFSHIMRKYPDLQFYDYTKDQWRTKRPNYHITYSYATMSPARIEWYRNKLANGMNLAIPVIAGDVKRVLQDIPFAFSMDTTDLRFLDGREASFGILKAKETLHTLEGVEEGFILDYEGVKELIRVLKDCNGFKSQIKNNKKLKHFSNV